MSAGTKPEQPEFITLRRDALPELARYLLDSVTATETQFEAAIIAAGVPLEPERDAVRRVLDECVPHPDKPMTVIMAEALLQIRQIVGGQCENDAHVRDAAAV